MCSWTNGKQGIRPGWPGLLAALLMQAVLASAPAAGADDAEAQAKEHFLKGKTLVEQGALREAIEELEQSYALNPLPGVLYNIAICWDELKEYAKAQEHYLEYLAGSPEVSEERKAVVKARLDYFGGFLGSLSIKGADDGAEVWIDGEMVGRTPLPDVVLMAGEHALVVKAPGLPDFEQSVTIAVGETTSVVVSLPEAPPETVEEVPATEAGSGQVAGGEQAGAEGPGAEGAAHGKKILRTPFIAVASIAGASFVTAIVTGTLALTTHREFKTKYYEDESEWKPLKDRSDALAMATDSLIGVGAAAAVTAVVLAVFTDWSADRERQADVGVGSGLLASPLLVPGGAGILVLGNF